MPSSQFAKRSWWWIVILAIGGIVAFCAAIVYYSGPIVGPIAREPTETLMQGIATAFVGYAHDYGALPPSPENYLLVKTFSGDNPRKEVYFSPHSTQINANREYIDAWGTPLRFSFTSKDDPMNVLIISAGPDKIFGTSDDITNQ
jgi:hypothetical protein